MQAVATWTPEAIGVVAQATESEADVAAAVAALKARGGPAVRDLASSLIRSGRREPGSLALLYLSLHAQPPAEGLGVNDVCTFLTSRLLCALLSDDEVDDMDEGEGHGHLLAACGPALLSALLSALISPRCVPVGKERDLMEMLLRAVRALGMAEEGQCALRGGAALCQRVIDFAIRLMGDAADIQAAERPFTAAAAMHEGEREDTKQLVSRGSGGESESVPPRRATHRHTHTRRPARPRVSFYPPSPLVHKSPMLR
jgi:hypothetical protein